MSSNAESRTVCWKVSNNLSEDIYPFVIVCRAIGGINPFFCYLTVKSVRAIWSTKLSWNSFSVWIALTFSVFLFGFLTLLMHSAHVPFNDLCNGKKTRKLIDNCYLELYPKMILVLSFDDESFICTDMELGTKSVMWCSLTRTWFRNGRNIQTLTWLLNYLNVL